MCTFPWIALVPVRPANKDVELAVEDALEAKEALRCMSQTVPLKSRSLAAHVLS